MLGILDRYIGKNVLYTVLIVTVLLTLLTTLITFIDKLRYIGRGSVDFAFLVEYIALQVPGILVMFFPVAVLLGGVIALGNLAKTSELIIMQASGVSRTGIIISSLKTLLPVILIVVILGEIFVPRISQYSESRLNYESSNGSVTLTYDGLWLREGKSFIGIDYIYSDGSLLNIVKYDMEKGQVKSISRATRGVYENDMWRMENVVEARFTGDKVEIKQDKNQYWKLNLNPDRVELVGANTQRLSLYGLIDYISYLEENNQDASSYRLDLYSKFVAPFSIVVMLLLAASTVFGPLRTVSMGTRIVSGIALGFAFYIANQIGAPFALVYGIYPIIGASAPTLIFLALALYLLSRKA